MSVEKSEARKWTLSELAELVGGRAEGNGNKYVTHVEVLQHADQESICHCSNSAQSRFLKSTSAGIVILPEEHDSDYSGDRLIVKNSRVSFARIVDLLNEQPTVAPGIDTSAKIDASATVEDSACIEANVVIGENVYIGNNVFIGAGTVVGNDVSIGERTCVHSNVSIYSNCKIGNHCRLFSGVVIGASGFSYEWDDEQWVSIHNVGGVVIGDRVDIGACTSIDRGSIRNTFIGDGVKIDNNVQVGHNVEIGDNSLIIGNVGIAGSVIIGKRCILGGQVAVASHIRIVDDVIIQASSLVTKSITVPGTYSSSVPAREATAWKRTLARLNRLDQQQT